MILRLYNGPTFSKWPKQVGVLVHSTKFASKSGLKSSNIEKRSFSTKNDVVLTYKAQNAYVSSSNLPL